MKTLNDIQTVVTHFSEQLPQAAHMTDVTMAGRITSVSSKSILPVDDGPKLHSFMLDDYIGETRVFVSQTCFEEFSSIIQVDRFVCIDAILNVIEKMPQKEFSVVAYDIRLM